MSVADLELPANPSASATALPPHVTQSAEDLNSNGNFNSSDSGNHIAKPSSSSHHGTEEKAHWTSWLLALVLGLVLFLDVTVYSFPLPFLPQHLDEQGYSTPSISVIMSIIWFSSIITILGNTIYTSRRSRLRATAAASRANLSNVNVPDRNGFLNFDPSREFFIVSAIIFHVGSVLVAGLFPEYAVLMIARALQGVASAFSWIFALALVTDIFPSSSRGMAISLVFAGNSMGEVVGPVVGGTLFHNFGMQVTFFSVAGLAGFIAVILLIALYLHSRHEAEKKADAVPTAQRADSNQTELAQMNQTAAAYDHQSNFSDLPESPRVTINVERAASAERRSPSHGPLPNDHPIQACQVEDFDAISSDVTIRSPAQLAGVIGAERELSVSRRSRSHSVSVSRNTLPPTRSVAPPLDLSSTLATPRSPFRDPIVIAVSVSVMLIGTVRTCVDLITPLYMDHQLGLNEFTVGMAFGVGAICYVITTFFAGLLVGKIPVRWSIMCGMAAFSCLCMVLLVSQDVIFTFILLGSIGVTIAFVTLGCSQWVTDRARQIPGGDIDTCMSLFNLLWFGGYGLGGVIGGLPEASDLAQQRITLMLAAASVLLFIPVFFYLTRDGSIPVKTVDGAVDEAAKEPVPIKDDNTV